MVGKVEYERAKSKRYYDKTYKITESDTEQEIREKKEATARRNAKRREKYSNNEILKLKLKIKYLEKKKAEQERIDEDNRLFRLYYS